MEGNGIQRKFRLARFFRISGHTRGFWEITERIPLFWRFQVAGWLIFIAATFPTKLVVCGNIFEALLSLLVRDGVSFLITLGMREIYRRIYRRYREPPWIICSILIVSAGAALLQLPFYFLFEDIFPYEEKTIFEAYAAIGIVSFRGAQFLGWSILYFGIKVWLEEQADQRRLHEERETRRRVELQMLRSLITSHFLCNSLNTILGAVHNQKPDVERMIQSLSDYLHYSLKHRSDYVVPLSEEIEALDNYVFLLKARLGSALDFAVQTGKESMSAKVPGFVLQPLVENAVKYGMESASHRVTVRVVIFHEGNDLVIQVVNTGRWVVPDPRRQSGGVR